MARILRQRIRDGAESAAVADPPSAAVGFAAAMLRAPPRAPPAPDVTQAVSDDDAGGACVVGLELSPGQSCSAGCAARPA